MTMKIAIVGTGIAGLGAAYVLSRGHEVELFEADDRAGGHVDTVTVGPHEVDTGFIVHNEANYPLLTRLFQELGVRLQDSPMTLSVECACGVSWSSRGAWRAGPRLLGEIARFLRTASRADVGGKTFDRFLHDERYSHSFRWHYLVPLVSALWSAAPGVALDFPAAYGVEFFRNHGMLGLRRHRWRTLTGGCRTYVRAACARIGGELHLRTPVRAVTRVPGGVEVRTGDDRVRRFDGIVLATHAPQALALLTDPSPEERRLLGVFATTENEVALHTDDRLLPRRVSDRSAWNYQSPGCGVMAERATITYSASRLQSLGTDRELCVTLNRTAAIDPVKILRVTTVAHPQVTLASMAAQKKLHLLNGPRATAFCGAWQGNGFHEDGLRSGVRAAEAFGARWI
jgi:predicted NAD/FAD-binding protein